LTFRPVLFFLDKIGKRLEIAAFPADWSGQSRTVLTHYDCYVELNKCVQI